LGHPLRSHSARLSGPGASSTRVTGRSSSRHEDAISEHLKPPAITSTRPGRAARGRSREASARVRRVKTPSSAASAGFGQGRARVPVAIRRRSYSTFRPSPRWTSFARTSRPVAATPSSHSASSRTVCASVVCSAGSQPVRTPLESGGRS
jgi:hypothetical protein